MPKRMVIGVLVVVLALSGLGLMTANAQEDVSPQAYLGVRITDTDGGVQVTSVERRSPAADAGVKVGDVITAVDDTAVASAEGLVELVQGYAPGDEITLAVMREDETLELTATLAERPSVTVNVAPTWRDRRPGVRGMLNMFGTQISVSDEGVVIEELDADSPLAEAGFMAGDVVTAVNGEALGTDANNIMALVDALTNSEDDTATFTVQRAGEEVEIEVDLSALDFPRIEMGLNMLDGLGDGVMIQRPLQLGVSYQTITPEVKDAEGLTVDEGALVMEVVADSPAEDAGLQAGDVILAVDGDVLDQERTLPDRLHAYEAGDVVTLTVLRDGEEIEVEVELGARGFSSVMPMQPGMFFGQGGENGRMPGFRFEMMPGLHGFSIEGMPSMEEFLQVHPDLQEFFEMMPDGHFEFHFGTPNEDVPAPDASTDSDAANTAA